MSSEEIEEKVRKSGTPPEKVFRRKMSQDEGLVIIYLMDLEEIFFHKNSSEKERTEELDNLKNSIDTTIPLIGYAIGIPKVSGDIGGTYLEYDGYEEECEEIEDEDFPEGME